MGAANLNRGIEEFWNLSSPKDFGVAGKNLFDQRGTRSRHANNEHRNGGRLAHTLAFPHELACKGRSQAIVRSEDGRLIVEYMLPFQRVSVHKVPKRSLVIAIVRKRLSQGEVQ